MEKNEGQGEDGEAAAIIVQEVIDDLNLKVITDYEMHKELDKLIAEFPPGTPYSKIMGEARRRFIYRKDMDKVALALVEKMKNKEQNKEIIK